MWGATKPPPQPFPPQPFQSTLPVWGATPATSCFFAVFLAFQSTLPVWGATSTIDITPGDNHISIHAPRVGSDVDWLLATVSLNAISIHAPRVGSDCQSGRHRPPYFSISIHAPRVGSDENPVGFMNTAYNFNPRSPCGERPVSACQCSKRCNFNPRSPCGERLLCHAWYS